MGQFTSTNYFGYRSIQNPLEKDAPLWKVVDEFNSTYYSGIDISMFFASTSNNEILVEDVISIQWALQQLTQPLFSYADYTAREFMRGTRHVMGQFTINFKEASYIPIIIAKCLDIEGTSIKGEYIDAEAKRQKTFAASQIVPDPDDVGLVNKISELIKGNPGYIADIAEMFDNANLGSPYILDEIVDPLLNDPFQPLYPDMDTFDIIIKFGMPNHPGRVYTTDAGDRRVTQRLEGQSIGTAKRIVSATLAGSQLQIDDSGRPIAETYMFYAKDIDSLYF